MRVVLRAAESLRKITKLFRTKYTVFVPVMCTFARLHKTKDVTANAVGAEEG